MSDLLAYERLNAQIISDGIQLLPGEFVLVRQAFRWLKNGSVVPNAYEMFEAESVCEDRGWVIVDRYGPHIVIARET